MLSCRYKIRKHIELKSILLLLVFQFSVGGITLSAKPTKVVPNKLHDLKIEVLACEKPFFYPFSKGFEAIKYGFEGGRMIKVGKLFHFITTEMPTDPHAVRTRIAHWNSTDGLAFNRVSTLFESDADTTGASQRAALWGPMPMFMNEDNKWHLFYVAYKSEPNVGESWKLNKDGIIIQAVSEIPGENGIVGPYKDRNVVMRYNENPDKWEGQQGVAAFFPYKIKRKWYAFYGTSRSQHMPTCKWLIGMAQAPTINGPWMRMTENNPTDSTAFAENPIVYKLDKNVYLTLVDGGPWQNKIGFLTSTDGVHWSKIKHINFESVTEKWWQIMRTPVGLFRGKDGTYSIYFTAYIANSKFPDKPFSTLSCAKLKISVE